VVQRAGQDYERLRQTAHTFIPLEEAIAVLYGFVATWPFPIPCRMCLRQRTIAQMQNRSVTGTLLRYCTCILDPKG
jgi:hypothetical protein